MRIVYGLTSLGMGGAERQVLALAERMKARGHAVLVVSLRGRVEEEWASTLDVARLEMRRTPGSALHGLQRLRTILNAFVPDLVHSHGFHANMMARLVKLVRPPTVVVSTVHNVYEGGWTRMLAYRLTDGLSRSTTAVSAAAAERFVRMKAIPAQKCVVMPNAIEVAQFAPDAGRRARMRKEMGVGEEFVWLAAGRVTEAKDYPNLLRGFALVRVECARAQLWIAGEGIPVRVGNAENVRWLGLRRDIAALYDAADGFVLSSAWEGMPLVIGEAMAMEKPVVATDAGGVRELVGDAGRIAAARDSGALGGAMRSTMRMSGEQRAALGRLARERIESKFSMEARTEEWEQFYLKVV